MLYDEYKKKMEKAYIIKNKILKFKYPAIVLISSLIIAFVIIAVMMGRSSGIEIASNFTYGDTIEYSCNPYMSEVIRYEFSSKEDSNWTEEVPTYVGDYQIRAISKGMFGEKVASVKDFSIDKKILNIDIVENKILYGTYPKTSLDGILSTDSLSGISYTFEDLSKSETTITITLSGIQIIDSNGVDVTSCYQMYSNATSGQSIEFEPRSIGLVPDISDKVYDGLALVYNNTYTVLYNEIGYEDEIVVTSSIKNSKNEVVSEAIVPDTYTISIENIYINGSSNYTNYTVTTSTKEVEITKRDIVIETSSQEKIYDGTYLEASSSSDIYLSSGYTLAYNDTLSLSTNTSKILNVGEKSNVLEAIIYNSNNEDVTDYYNISYNYGTLKVSERDLYITSSSSTKVYDGTALSSKSYTYTNLVEGESINLVSNNSIKDVGIVNNILVVEVLDSSNNISSNYNIIYNYGSLEVTKSSLTIGALDMESISFNANTYSYPEYSSNFKIIEGSLYDTDTISYVSASISNDLYTEAFNAGQYEINISNVYFEDINDINNYDISFVSASFEILKNKVEISPLDVVHTFDWNVYSYDNSTYQVSSGKFYNNEILNINVNYTIDNEIVSPLNVNTYTINILSIDTDTLTLNNNEITYTTSTLTIDKKDVSLSLSYQSSTYDYLEKSYSNSLIEVSDELLIDSLIVTESHCSSTIFYAGTYTIIIDSYEFNESDDILESNFNIILETSTYEVLKRDITIEPSLLDSIVYDGSIHSISTTSYSVVSGSFVGNDETIAIIVDSEGRDLLNAGNYSLIISDYDHSIDSNYNVTISSKLIDFVIEPLEIEITPEEENYTFGEYRRPNTNYTFNANSLCNSDYLTIETTFSNLTDISESNDSSMIYGAGTYLKSIVSHTFYSGDSVSKESNYSFVYNTSTITILKRDITILPLSYTKVYYDSIDISYASFENDTYSYGLASDDYITYELNYTDDELLKLEVGTYEISITSFDILRSGVSESDYSFENDYNITLLSGTLTISQREIIINAPDIEITYDKEYHTYDTYINNEANFIINDPSYEDIPYDLEITKLEYEFILDNESYISVINANTYTLKLTGYNSSNLEYVTKNFIISYLTSSYVINPLDINISYSGENVTYDGKYHSPTKSFKYLNENSFIDTDVSISFVDEYSYINAGQYEILINVDSLSNDLLTNYSITISSEIFEIDERHVYISASIQSYIYDSSYATYDYSSYIIIEDDSTIRDSILIDNTTVTFSVVFVDSNNETVIPINAGTYYVYVTNIVDSNNFIFESLGIDDKKEFYVLERNITFSIDVTSKIYDGIDIEDETINYVVIKDEDSDVYRVGYTGYDSLVSLSFEFNDTLESHKDVGVYELIITILEIDSSNLNIIINNPIEYSITSRSVYLKALDITKVYDGLPNWNPYSNLETLIEYSSYSQSDSNYQFVESNPFTYLVSTVEVSETLVDAGSYTSSISSVESNSESLLLSNYNLILETGTVTISQREVDVYPVDLESVVYDYEEHLNYDSSVYIVHDVLTDEIYANVLPDGTTISVDVLYYQNDLATSPIDAGVYSIHIISVSTNNNFIFNLNYKYSTFEILKRSISVKLEDSTKVYDGDIFVYQNDYQIIDNYTTGSNPLPDTITLNSFNYYQNSVVTDPINAGSYTYELTDVSTFKDGVDTTNNYEIDLDHEYTLVITKANAYVNTVDVTHIYDAISYTYDSSVESYDENNQELGLELEVEVYYTDSNSNIVSPIEIGTYTIYISNVIASETDSNNYNFIINSTSTLTIETLEIYVSFNESSYDSIYGDSFDMTDNYTISSNSNAFISANALFNYELDGTTYQTTSTLDANIYQINFLGLTDILINSNSVDEESINISFTNEATLNINRRTIVVSFVSQSKEYDGTNINTISYYATNIIESDQDNIELSSYTILRDGETTDTYYHAGTYTVSSISLEYISKSVSFNNNYITTINSDNVVYEISQRYLDLEASIVGDSSIDFDSETHSLEYSYTYTTNLDGDTFEFSQNITSFFYAKTYNISFNIDSIQSLTYNSDISDYYIDEEVSFVINPLDITIITGSTSFEYDGLYHSYESYEVSGLLDNNSIEINSADTFKAVGTYQNVLTFIIYDNTLNYEVNTCYNITIIYGSVEITKVTLNISSISQSATYNGRENPYTSLGFKYSVLNLADTTNSNSTTFTIGQDLFNLYKVNSLSLYNVGTYLDSFTITVYLLNDYEEIDVSSYFDILYTFEEYITINQLDVYVTTSDASREYDGSDFDLENIYNVLLEDDTALDNGDSYSINSKYITLNGSSVNEVHRAGSYIVTINDLIFEYNDEDVSSNYNVIYNSNTSTITITRVELIFKTMDREFVWDGLDKYVTTSNFLVTISGYYILDPLTLEEYSLPEGEVELSDLAVLSAYRSDGSKWLSNSVEATCSFDILVDDQSYLDCYNFTILYGTLSFITDISIEKTVYLKYTGEVLTIDSVEGTVIYQGIEQKTSNFEVVPSYATLNGEVTELLNFGQYVLVPDTSSLVINVLSTSGTVSIYGSDYEAEGIEINYELYAYVTSRSSGDVVNLLIKPSTIKLEYNGETQSYDSQSVTYTIVKSDSIASKNNITLGTLQSGDTLLFSTSLEATYVGMVTGIIKTYQIIDAYGNDVTEYYNLLNVENSLFDKSTYYAKLQIMRRDISISYDESSYKYDGQYHYLNNLSFDDSLLVSGDSVSLVGLLNPGYSAGLVITNSDGNDVTKYYDVSYTALEVLRLTLCISSGSATKVYDGTALICETYTLNTYASDGTLMDGLRDGDTLTVVFKGSITKVGSMNNYFTIVVKDSSGNNVTKLYNFTSYWILGVLTVTE